MKPLTLWQTMTPTERDAVVIRAMRVPNYILASRIKAAERKAKAKSKPGARRKKKARR